MLLLVVAAAAAGVPSRGAGLPLFSRQLAALPLAAAGPETQRRK